MIVIENEPSASVLKSQLETEMPDAAVVNVNYVETPTDLRTNRKGLTVAALHAVSGQLIILTSFEPEESLRQDERFVSLMSKPNVAFLRLPARIDDYRKAYQALRQ